MKEFMKDLSEVLNDTNNKIDEIRKKYQFTSDEEEVNRVCSIYKNILGYSIQGSENDTYEKITNAEQGRVSSYIVTTDPTIIQTKSGKKIVLSEDPIAIRTSSGKKIVLENDPIIAKKGARIVLDEDPISIETKSGKKIVLDEDPITSDIKSNNIAIIESKLNNIYTPSPWTSYEDNIAFITDDEPVIVELNKGKKIILDSDPISYKNKEGKRIVLDKDPIVSKGMKRITLNEDPISIETKSGKRIVLDEDPVIKAVGKKNNNKKIVLNEDPISISVL